ncbi:MAG: potassium/proton antiporter [Ignavibacteria bacterium]|nr:potassium/proton antiporter [Ignavibacteria bacterium]
MAIEYILLVGPILILISIAIARFSDNLGVPTMLLFLGIGMLAGSEGPGGIRFDDPGLAQSIGIIALVFILFAGGLDTNWSQVRPTIWQASSLATLGVFLTTLAVGAFLSILLDFSLMNGLLLGAIVSSTDAAAVFSVLRSRNMSLRGQLKPLLELESGSNDPTAVFLTIGLIQLLTNADSSVGSLALLFIFQMGLGAAFGYGLGKAMVFFLNRLKLAYEGIYPVFSLAFAALVYGATASIGGSGFLAVYIAGLVASNAEFIHKKSLLRFFDGLAWLSQITMFVTLGLLVFPSQIIPIMGLGLLVSGFLMLVARPLSVFISLSLSKFQWREKAFISWVGLRGAIPIVLATFPLLAGLPDAGLLFNLVFFIVLTSALFQGWSVPIAARVFKVDAPPELKRRYPLEFSPIQGVDTELVDLIVPYNSPAAGKPIVELGMPPDSLIVLVSRDESFLVPSGGTVLQEGDTVLVLVNKNNLPQVRSVLAKQKPTEGL